MAKKRIGALGRRETEEKALLFRSRPVRELRFGTSGLRGLVSDITDLEAYVNTRGFLNYLFEIGDLQPGGVVSIGGDLRPSTDSPERSILRAVARAVEDSGCKVDYLGKVPTPALTYWAMQQKRPSIMVTGSHIPFDRNGIKFNKSTGEVLKDDEPGILEAVRRVRREVYSEAPEESIFNDDGFFKEGVAPQLPPVNNRCAELYLDRYLSFFPPGCLSGLRVLFYQHSAVGRDLLVDLLKRLGAEVIPAGRSDTFVAIDTEAISDELLGRLAQMVEEVRRTHGPVDAVVSTDGDSDRPLFVAVAPDGSLRFYGGDLLGILVADYLGADCVVVPVSANDAVDIYFKSRGITPIKTRIGSPYVIAAMQAASGSRRVAWEANGGFLTGTPIEKDGRVLDPLPTRDSAIVLCSLLASAREKGCSVADLFKVLPERYSRAALLDNVPSERSAAMLRRFRPSRVECIEAVFQNQEILLVLPSGSTRRAEAEEAEELRGIREELARYFTPARGFDAIERLNFLDGVRIYFHNGDIAHVRPSGNAPQLRIYAVSSRPERTEQIIKLALQDPGGILRQLEEVGKETLFIEGVKRNIAFTEQLCRTGETPEVIGTVCGSEPARRFWQKQLECARRALGARVAVSFHEDLPVNQAFGILLLWQRLKPYLTTNRGALVAFVFGEGTRSTPFTEADNGQKPAMSTFVTAEEEGTIRYLPIVELALRYFVPVQQFLRRSGFDGIVVKWGDEVQIPMRDLSGSDPLFKEADVVRFVSMREMDASSAANKDWLGVAPDGCITAFIPRRPLGEMEKLADRGLLIKRNGRLYGGVNLGSIALSRALLDLLLEEFEADVNNPNAERSNRPDLDPQFFTALCIAAIKDPEQRRQAWSRAVQESSAAAKLARMMPDLLERLVKVLRRFEERHGRPVKMVALDFEDQYWGDLGQHRQIFEFYMALNDRGALGRIARAIAGLPEKRDAQGNIIAGRCTLGAGAEVRNSVLLNVTVTGSGKIEDSVLVGTQARVVNARKAFDVLSTARELHLEPRAGTYKVVSTSPVRAGPGERLTTVFLPDGALLMRVTEQTDLRDRKNTYEVPILGNPLSFHRAHQIMSAQAPEEVAARREKARGEVLALIQP